MGNIIVACFLLTHGVYRGNAGCVCVLCRRAGQTKRCESRKLCVPLWTRLSGKDLRLLLCRDSPSIASASCQISRCVIRRLCHQPHASGRWRPLVSQLYHLSFIRSTMAFTSFWTTLLGDGLQLAVMKQLNISRPEISNCGCQLFLVFTRCLIFCNECLTLSVFVWLKYSIYGVSYQVL